LKRVLGPEGALDFSEQQESPPLEATGGDWGFLEQQLDPFVAGSSDRGVGGKLLLEFIAE
jgi:hypothetical protein